MSYRKCLTSLIGPSIRGARARAGHRKREDMRSRQLECFVCICETGSITRAAAKLNIAQPALGVQLRTLEQEFGAKLLIRSPAGTVPTAAGRLFLDEARNILRKLDDLKRRLREVEE